MLVELRESLEALLYIRLTEGKWNDSENEPGILRNLEAFSCFGSPAYYYDKLKILDRRFEIIKVPEDALISDINNVIKRVNEVGYPPEPYLDSEMRKFNIKYQKGKTDFVDTASFISSSILDLMEYYEVVYNKEIELSENLLKVLKDSLDWLVKNAIDMNGKVAWSWGNKDFSESIPSVYFTWSAVVALSYAVSSKYSPLSDVEKSKIKSLLAAVGKWIEDIIADDVDFPGERWRIKYPRFSDTFNGKAESLLVYVVSIFDWLSQIDIEVQRDVIYKILKTILDIYRKSQMWRFEGGSHIILIPPEITDGKTTFMLEYEDRACEYLLLSALSWYYMKHNEKKYIIEDSDYQDLENLIEELRKKLINDRDPVKKLWKKDGFLLYLTQRAIEAITTYLRYVYPYKGIELSLQDIVKLAVESALEEMKPNLIEKIHKNIELLSKKKEK